jgi:hypothetical protein
MDRVAKLSGRQKVITGLVVVTAVIHILLGIMSEGAFLILFLLNGIGYLTLVAGLYFLPQFAGRRSLFRWVLIGYAVLTVILFFVLDPEPLSSGLGLFTKAVEAMLIILLLMEE